MARPTFTSHGAGAGVSINIPDVVRGACEQSDHNKGVIQEAMRKARRNKGRDLNLTGESGNSPIVATPEELASSKVFDETPEGRYMVPIAIVADPSWPTGNGIRKDYNKSQWEAIAGGVACFRCGWELPLAFADCPVPGPDSQRPGCGWTQVQTSRAFDTLFERRFMEHQMSQQALRRMLNGGKVA